MYNSLQFTAAASSDLINQEQHHHHSTNEKCTIKEEATFFIRLQFLKSTKIYFHLFGHSLSHSRSSSTLNIMQQFSQTKVAHNHHFFYLSVCVCACNQITTSFYRQSLSVKERGAAMWSTCMQNFGGCSILQTQKHIFFQSEKTLTFCSDKGLQSQFQCKRITTTATGAVC